MLLKVCGGLAQDIDDLRNFIKSKDSECKQCNYMKM